MLSSSAAFAVGVGSGAVERVKQRDGLAAEAARSGGSMIAGAIRA